MIQRILKLPKNSNILLFGARGTGKTTLLRERFPDAKWFNLLDLNLEASLRRDPDLLTRQVLADKTSSHIIIDDIQKLPKLLDIVHNLIETPEVHQKFILTGSSARKLKAGGANLLAGRALVYHLYPLTVSEVTEDAEQDFSFGDSLKWGMLPGLNNLEDELKNDFLRTYANTYLKEEIWGEHLVRNLDPFRRFIEVAAQVSGKILNYSNIARDCGVDTKTVQNWFSILEDTLIGYTLPAYHRSIRKQLRMAPKFYLFDIGVTRALSMMLNVPPHPQTSYYGELFEQFVITQLLALSAYRKDDYRFYYLQTKNNIEVDLIIERPGRPPALVEIKSTTSVTKEHLKNLILLQDDFPDADLYLCSLDDTEQNFGRVMARGWNRMVGDMTG